MTQGLAYALGLTGRLYEIEQQWQPAATLTLESLTVASAYTYPTIAYQFLWQLGRIRKAQGQSQAAIAAYTQAVDIVTALRQDLVTISAEAKFNFRKNIEPVYRELVDLLLPPGVEVSQAILKTARAQIEALKIAELNNFFRDACLEIPPQQIDQIDPNAAVIYSIAFPERLVTILALSGQLFKYEVPIAQNQIDQVYRDFFRHLNPIESRNSTDSASLSAILGASQKLYRWLIEPLETQLDQSQVKTLVFVMDGFLRNLPLASLHDGKQFLIEKYDVALNPGLQLAKFDTRIPQETRLLIGGLSEARQDFSPLPAVEAEITEISIRSAAEVLFNQTFTKEKLEERFNQLPFPIVHLATHGQFSSNLDQTFILTWDDKIQIKDLERLLAKRKQQNLTPVQLLVLSACQTATGDDRAALGLAGLAVRSGAISTLATLWSVDDQSTAELMVEFYQQLFSPANLSKAHALRQAQLQLLQSDQYRHPYYWAGFVMVGHWL
ncbi:MAG: CHAT domain-containing protein [Oscillatoriales cyanobacterium RM2_1_1]|nr:CHAT domain-containing protein [Oscillatoriales cyanobacterium RM2_1_1]